MRHSIWGVVESEIARIVRRIVLRLTHPHAAVEVENHTVVVIPVGAGLRILPFAVVLWDHAGLINTPLAWSSTTPLNLEKGSVRSVIIVLHHLACGPVDERLKYTRSFGAFNRKQNPGHTT
jgi:hypothetical protein